MVPDNVQLSVSPHQTPIERILTLRSIVSFPLPIVYRIFDHLLATGVESIFGFSLVLLQSNEDQLLKLKFDSILDYLKSALFDAYLVRSTSGLLATPRLASDFFTEAPSQTG